MYKLRISVLLRKYIILLLILISSSWAQSPYRDFEIVESIPIETVLDNAEIRNTATVWLEMIDGATETLDIEQFYIANQAGEALEPVICAIEKAARRGVNVRVLVDARMAKTYPETLERLNKQSGIQVRTTDLYNKGGGVQHSKFFIVDHLDVFIGSQNFDWRALDHIHEVGLRIRHQEYARRMTELFELDWQQSKGEQILDQTPSVTVDWLTLRPQDQEPVFFLATASPDTDIPSSMQPDLPQIVRLINQANKRVFVQLLTYSPAVRGGANFTSLEAAMIQAAKRGVDVRLLCSDWCTKSYEIPYLKKLVQLPGLQVTISTIPEWSGGYIPFARVEHCKYMIVDDSLSWIGSSNWEKNYFSDSRNVGVIIRNSQVNTLLSNIFLKSWDGPYVQTVDPQKEYKPKFYGERH